MKWDDDNSKYTLDSSGRTFYAHNGTLGMGPDADCLEYGSDGSVGFDGEDIYGESLTDAERAEIAAHMIGLWERWKTREVIPKAEPP